MEHPELRAEVARRRTFAIISHPDAGKTTLTEKLLLYGGAIRQAGSVKARKAARHATSDWMEIEKQRGISVTSSAMQFDYDGYRINILDTPGHQDFSEDTYRTLVAADSAVMLIDNVKGVEEQTIKLFKVCRLRSIPIFTFVNKMDRAGRDPFELMEEIEQVLGIRSCPVNWPIGIHGDFKGVYHRDTRMIELYRGGDHGQTQVEVQTVSFDDPECPNVIGKGYYDKLCEDVELLDVAGDPFDLEKVLAGQLTPMFFGSATNNFGVEPFLRRFLTYTKSPTPRKADAISLPAGGETVEITHSYPIRENERYCWRVEGVSSAGTAFSRRSNEAEVPKTDAGEAKLTLLAEPKMTKISRRGYVPVTLTLTNDGSGLATKVRLSEETLGELTELAVVAGGEPTVYTVRVKVSETTTYRFRAEYLDETGRRHTASAAEVEIAIGAGGERPEGEKPSEPLAAPMVQRTKSSDLYLWLLAGACAVLLVLSVGLMVSSRRARRAKKERAAARRQRVRENLNRPRRREPTNGQEK